MILNAVFLTGSPQAGFISKGAGATFPRPLYEEWIKLYEKQNGIRIGYRGIGSGDFKIKWSTHLYN